MGIRSSLIRLGGHHSSSESLLHVVAAARGLGHNALQTMLGGEHDWNPFTIEQPLLMKFKALSFGIDVFIHLPFVMNPCSEGRLKAISKATLRKYLNLSQAMGARAVILHPGFKKELEERVAYSNFIKFLSDLREDDRLKICVETDSGSKNGSAIGSLGFISRALRDLKDNRIRMCIDTAHLYARGVSMWDKDTRDSILSTYGDQIEMVHLNAPDPDVELGSFRDRHNTPLSEFRHNSEEMITTLSCWPMILERRSLAVQEEDTKMIYNLLRVSDKQPSL